MSCSEERDHLDQSLGQWRSKVDVLEKTNCDIRNLISILEDDIRAGRKEYEALKTSMDKVASEKQQVRASDSRYNQSPQLIRFTNCSVYFF